jgi:hypothetical protein
VPRHAIEPVRQPIAEPGVGRVADGRDAERPAGHGLAVNESAPDHDPEPDADTDADCD